MACQLALLLDYISAPRYVLKHRKYTKHVLHVLRMYNHLTIYLLCTLLSVCMPNTLFIQWYLLSFHVWYNKRKLFYMFIKTSVVTGYDKNVYLISPKKFVKMRMHCAYTCTLYHIYNDNRSMSLSASHFSRMILNTVRYTLGLNNLHT